MWKYNKKEQKSDKGNWGNHKIPFYILFFKSNKIKLYTWGHVHKVTQKRMNILEM